MCSFKAAKNSLTLCCSINERKKNVLLMTKKQTNMFLSCVSTSKIPGLNCDGN